MDFRKQFSMSRDLQKKAKTNPPSKGEWYFAGFSDIFWAMNDVWWKEGYTPNIPCLVG